jgi:hypothetical protein
VGSVVAKSLPTIPITPARPISSPTSPIRVIRSVPPVAWAKTEPTSGTPAISSPVSELERWSSADPRATQGIAISIAAKATTHGQRAKTARRSTRAIAIGRRIAAAIAVRHRTSVAGVISATAIRMNR